MSLESRRRILKVGVFGLACACAAAAPRFGYAESPSGKYVCPPCGCSADGKVFDAPGDCPACGMPLMPKPADPPKVGGASGFDAVAHRKGRDGWGTRTRT